MKISRLSTLPGFDSSTGIAALMRWKRESAAESAAALAFCRSGPNDLRPELLLWHYGGDDRYEHIADAFVRIRVVLWCAMRGVALTQDVLEAVAIDALELVQRGRAAQPADQRARGLHRRACVYRDIRNAAVRALIDGIRSGRERFGAALQGPDGFTPRTRQTRKNITPKAA